MSKNKKAFEKATAPASAAITHVLKVMGRKEEADLPDAVLAQAVKDGLAKHFSFIVQDYTHSETSIAEGNSLFAWIYPTSEDTTFKCPDIIRPLVPKAHAVDACCETEWNFDKNINTPVKVAQALLAQGLVWDEKTQKKESPAVYKQIKAALTGSAAKTKPRKGSKT